MNTRANSMSDVLLILFISTLDKNWTFPGLFRFETLFPVFDRKKKSTLLSFLQMYGNTPMEELITFNTQLKNILVEISL